MSASVLIANNLARKTTLVGRSTIYARESFGTRSLTFGTVYVAGAVDENLPSTSTFCIPPTRNYISNFKDKTLHSVMMVLSEQPLIWDLVKGF